MICRLAQCVEAGNFNGVVESRNMEYSRVVYVAFRKLCPQALNTGYSARM